MNCIFEGKNSRPQIGGPSTKNVKNGNRTTFIFNFSRASLQSRELDSNPGCLGRKEEKNLAHAILLMCFFTSNLLLRPLSHLVQSPDSKSDRLQTT